MTTYRQRIETIISELEDIEETIPTQKYSFELETSIRALSDIVNTD
jgi:hypothetical protein